MSFSLTVTNPETKLKNGWATLKGTMDPKYSRDMMRIIALETNITITATHDATVFRIKECPNFVFEISASNTDEEIPIPAPMKIQSEIAKYTRLLNFFAWGN